MSNEPQVKKMKKHHDFKKNFHSNQNNRKQFIEPGQRGFLATCNFKEKACVRECYNILNHFADELYGPINPKSKDLNASTEKEEVIDEVNSTDDKDITDDLEEEIQNAKSERKNKYRFQVVDTGTLNCMFIKTSLPDPVELGLAIVKDIAATKKQHSRHLLRLVPIHMVTRANLKDIVDAAGALFDKHFLKNPKTFSIIFNKRYNNNIKRDDVIKELADIVTVKNAKNKVDLKNAEVSVIVEVIKGLCCLSVVPSYLKYKKYNLVELAGKDLDEPAHDTASKDDVKSSPGNCSKLPCSTDSKQELKMCEDVTSSEDCTEIKSE